MSRLVVVTAGLSQPSSSRLLGERLAEAVRASLAVDGEIVDGELVDGEMVDVVVVELRDLAHDVVNNVLTGFPPPALARVVEQIAAADGLIAVTPIFNASYSGLFKSFFDVLDPELLRGKPVLIAATGGSERHSLALEHAVRPLFSYLHAITVPTAVYAASSDWGSTGGGTGLAERIERAGAELADLMSRLGPISAVTPPSFLDLLRR
jgi:FMN reductase